MIGFPTTSGTLSLGVNDAADAVEVRRRKSYATATGQGEGTSRRRTGALPQSRDLSKGRVGDPPTRDTLRPSPPTPKIPEIPSPFITRTPAGSNATKKKIKKLQQRDFRTWQDSTGFHRQEAALVDYEAGIVFLSLSDGMLLEVPESKLSGVDRNYVRSQDVYRRAQRKAPRDGPGEPADTKHLGVFRKFLTLIRLRRNR